MAASLLQWQSPIVVTDLKWPTQLKSLLIPGLESIDIMGCVWQEGENQDLLSTCAFYFSACLPSPSPGGMEAGGEEVSTRICVSQGPLGGVQAILPGWW